MALIWIWVVLFIFLVLWGYASIATIKRTLYGRFNLRKRGALPSLVVGNLSVGGSGKTPMVMFLLEAFKNENVGVLSRGYGRKTSGYKQVFETDTALEVGDEPLEIKGAKTETFVAVCEDRLEGIRKIKETGNIDWVILDDGYQHLALQSERSVVLASYNQPFWEERFSLPVGRLREFSSSAKEATALVITKCPENLSISEIESISKRLDFPIERIFAAVYRISKPLLMIGKGSESRAAVFVSGIAESKKHVISVDGWHIKDQLCYSDHYQFKESDVQYWLKTCEAQKVNSLILTRKDFQRIRNNALKSILLDSGINVYEVHTEVELLWNKKDAFLALVHP